jgi:hypothetical protein
LGGGLDGLFHYCYPSLRSKLAQVLLAKFFLALALGFKPSGFGFLVKTFFFPLALQRNALRRFFRFLTQFVGV